MKVYCRHCREFKEVMSERISIFSDPFYILECGELVSAEFAEVQKATRYGVQNMWKGF